MKQLAEVGIDQFSSLAAAIPSEPRSKTARQRKRLRAWIAGLRQELTESDTKRDAAKAALARSTALLKALVAGDALKGEEVMEAIKESDAVLFEK